MVGRVGRTPQKQPSERTDIRTSVRTSARARDQHNSHTQEKRGQRKPHAFVKIFLKSTFHCKSESPKITVWNRDIFFAARTAPQLHYLLSGEGEKGGRERERMWGKEKGLVWYGAKQHSICLPPLPPPSLPLLSVAGKKMEGGLESHFAAKRRRRREDGKGKKRANLLCGSYFLFLLFLSLASFYAAVNL